MTEATCPTKRRALYTWLVRGALGLALLAVAMSTREPLVAIPALLAALIAAHNFAPSTRKDAS